MFDEGPHRRLRLLHRLAGRLLRPFGHGFDQPAFARDLPVDLALQRHDLRALLHAGVARVGMHLLLLAVQEFRGLRDVGDVRRRRDHGVHQLAVPVRADVRFHPEIPLVAFLGLVHFRVALLFLVLGGGRRGDQRGVHQGAFAQQQALRGEVGVDGGEEALAQIVGLQQAAELQERRGVRHALGIQVDASEAAQRLAVVEGVFEGFIGQAIPLLEEIDPQHPLQPDRRAAALALRIVRRDDGQQPGPRENCLHPREELLAPGDLLLLRKLGLGETGLVDHASQFGKSPPRRLQ